MLMKLSIYLTVGLLVWTKQYRLFGMMYVQLWEFSLLICLVIWLGKIALIKKTSLQFDSLNIALIIFLIINIFSSIRIPDHAGTFSEGGMWWNLRTFEPFLLYLIISDHLSSRENIKPLLYCVFGILCLECVLGLAQSLANVEWVSARGWLPSENPRGYLYYFTGYGDPSVTAAYGTFGHFNGLGLYLSVFIPLITSLLFFEQIIERRFGVLLAALTITTFVLTYSRGALLGTIAGLMIMLSLNKRNRPLMLLLSSTFFITAAGLVSLSAVSRGYIETLNLAPRIEIWKTALGIIFQDPNKFIFGTGSGTHLYWTHYEAQGVFWTPHNSYIMIWLETGFLGLLSFLSVFIIFYSRNLKLYLSKPDQAANAIAFAMIGIIPSLLVQFFFQTGFGELWIKALTLIFVAIGASVNQRPVSNNALK